MTRQQPAGSAAALVCALLIMGCAQAGSEARAGTPAPPATPERTPMIPAPLQEAVQAALKDAAGRTGSDAASLKVALAEEVTWPNGGMGCPAPGRMYTQALVPGYRIRITAGSQTLEYHGGRQGPPAFCPADRVTGPVPGATSS